MTNEPDAPKRIWVCTHLGKYGHYYPEAVEAEGEWGGVAVPYVPEAISDAKDKRVLGPQSPDEEAVFAYEARIVDLENKVGKRDKRIAELELQQSKDWANINVKANFIDKCLNDIDVKDELIFKLTKALGTIKGWDVGPSGSTTAERSMRRIAEQALTAQTRD